MDALDAHSETKISDLPPELVDNIFHYACILSTSFCVALCQISTWTRRLALPYLYSTVVLKDMAAQEAFSRNLLPRTVPIHPPQPDFHPTKYVRSLWTEAVSSRVLSIFAPCDGISNLALHVDNFLWLIHASSTAALRVSKLSTRSITRKNDLYLLILDAQAKNWSQKSFVNNNASLTSPIFEKITHLRVGSIGSYSTHLDLAHFTRLSHIAVPYHRPQEQNLSDLLRVFDFPSTIFLVVVLMTDLLSTAQYQEAVDWVIQTRVTNSGIYTLTSRQPDLQAEWEAEVRRGLSIWDKAEIFTQTLTSRPLISST
ncbi:hypothetical protein GALMADRAFT_575278 [Galerina marginata CBS 339.88]|uniref:F-box domain-containing protein n=1 Tax=Galerina marginata (strain CBS 339.88) TaxID=685588 RepID=A0A067T5J6_GALM3|nr:hypothetical protein GALMADRAFT_575278 [Galerina marginata CBS 339.88]